MIEESADLPFIFVSTICASSSDAKVTNPNPFDLTEALSIKTLAGVERIVF